jgi:hypothetical protein
MNNCIPSKNMDERITPILVMLGTIVGLAAGYGLGGWMEYRKGFETGLSTAVTLANSITVTPKDE